MIKAHRMMNGVEVESPGVNDDGHQASTIVRGEVNNEEDQSTTGAAGSGIETPVQARTGCAHTLSIPQSTSTLVWDRSARSHRIRSTQYAKRKNASRSVQSDVPFASRLAGSSYVAAGRGAEGRF